MKRGLPNKNFNRKDAKAQRKSQRDLIIQPSVDAMQLRLRWVVNHKMKSTLKELNRFA
jgi:hypothetical protein